jgi:hypothetical protein
MEPAESAPLSRVAGTQPSLKRAFLLVMLASTAVVMPFFFFGNASGHDIQFHISSWMDVAGQWREGIIYPRWAEWANWGFGEPRFIFYPPLSWIAGAALGSLLPWSAIPVAYISLALIVAGMAMRTLAREWLPPAQSAIAAVFFILNPYNLAMVYYRSDFSELLGVALLPFMLWGALRAIRCDWHRMPALAVVFAAIWLSSAPEGVIATYSLALLFVIAAMRQRSPRPLFLGGMAMITGFGLAAFYLLPAAWERNWVQISQALVSNLQPEKNFLFARSSDAEFQLFNWKMSGIAVEMMLVTGLAAVSTVRRRRALGKIWWMLLALGIASALLMFRPSAPLWRHLPELAFLQFPWRWLGPLGVVFAFFSAAAIADLRQRARRRIAVALLVAAIAVTGALIATSTWWNSEDASLIAGEIASGHGYEGVDEYEPVGDDRYSLPNATPDAVEVPNVPATPALEAFDPASGELVPPRAPTKLNAQQWSSERKRFSVASPEPVTIAVRLLNYPSWEVQVDGKDVRARAAPETAELVVPLTSGAHEVEIRFRRTPDRTAGDAISVFSAIVLLGFAIFARRRSVLTTAAGA